MTVGKLITLLLCHPPPSPSLPYPKIRERLNTYIVTYKINSIQWDPIYPNALGPGCVHDSGFSGSLS